LVKNEGKTIGFFNEKKLLPFYQKFKKILKKHLSIPKRVLFLINIIKIEVFYTEDKIIFIENELTDLRKKKLSWITLFLITYILCRYYVFLGIPQKKLNWGNQCIIIGKKKNDHKKNKFDKLVIELTQIHLNKKIKNDFYFRKATSQHSFFIDMFHNLGKNEKFIKRIQTLLSIYSIQKTENKKKIAEKKPIQLVPQNQVTTLLFKSQSVRNNFEKTDWFFDINIYRIKKKEETIPGFFEKPKKSSSDFLHFSIFHRKKIVCSILNVCQKKFEKKKIRWSIFTKLFMFCFPETEFFLVNFMKKNNNQYFIEQNRQLINNFFFLNYFPCATKEMNERKNILWRRVLFIFFNLPVSFFLGWSCF